MADLARQLEQLARAADLTAGRIPVDVTAAARGVLQLSWAGAARPLPNDAPTPWQARWDEYALQNEEAVSVFNDAVAQYNAAIAQFPANLLAWTFGFKAARGL